jgi:hypothetical protein
MLAEYEKIKDKFELEFMSSYISEDISKDDISENTIKDTIKDTSENIKISLCIPTKDRFDNFLNNYLEKYIQYLNDNVIHEIIISDENGNDYNKISEKYGTHNPKLKLYKNDSVLGVFLNKIKVCSYASNNYIALIDSDNFPSLDYFTKVKKYIEDNLYNLSKNFLLMPSFAKPNFNYKSFENLIITRQNIKSYYNKGIFNTLLNTGNYIISKNIVDNIQYNKDILMNISACDVQYFNLLVLQQFDNAEFHIIQDLEYDHIVHGGSTYLTTIGHCCNTCEEHVYSQFMNL